MGLETLAVAVAAMALVAFVAAYVFRPLVDGSGALESSDPRTVALLIEREAILASLRDLDADYSDRRLSEADYQSLRGETLGRGARVLAALDQVAADSAGRSEALMAELEAEIRAAGGGDGAAVAVAGTEPCTRCGRPVRPGDHFCSACGQSLAGGEGEAQ